MGEDQTQSANETKNTLLHAALEGLMIPAEVFAENKETPAASLPVLALPKTLEFNQGTALLTLELPQHTATSPQARAALGALEQTIKNRLEALDNITTAQVLLTMHHDAQNQPKNIPKPETSRQPRPQQKLTGVRFLVVIASGKGGVGKSTTATNLAVALAQQGWRVGLLDADIYGPSQPRLLGLKQQPEIDESTKKIIPLEAYGIACMSIGCLIEEETPMIWRGPMVQSALRQLLHEVDWGQRDVLILDLPPGTGDAQLTLVQQTPLSGAVIVSTPQDLALLDARKGLNMFRKTEVPILGIVENMSIFVCPNCGHHSPIFDHGGAEKEAQRLNVPFLGAIPLNMEIRKSADHGHPIVVAQPSSPEAACYHNLAIAVRTALTTNPQRPAPKMTCVH